MRTSKRIRNQGKPQNQAKPGFVETRPSPNLHNAGLQKRALQGTSVVVWKTLHLTRSREARRHQGEGKFEGEGGLSGPSRPFKATS